MDDKTVKDIMLPLSEYATISQERTLREALVALDNAQLGLTNDRHHHRAVLVLDAQGDVVGKLSHWAILRKLEPRFLDTEALSALCRENLTADYMVDMEESLSDVLTGLSGLCRRASGVKAKEAMVPAGESIDQDASLVSAIHQLVVSHANSMLVTHDGRTVGILRLSDVFETVAAVIKSDPYP